MLGVFVINVEIVFKVAGDTFFEIFWGGGLVNSFCGFKVEEHIPFEGVGYMFC